MAEYKYGQPQPIVRNAATYSSVPPKPAKRTVMAYSPGTASGSSPGGANSYTSAGVSYSSSYSTNSTTYTGNSPSSANSCYSSNSLNSVPASTAHFQSFSKEGMQAVQELKAGKVVTLISSKKGKPEKLTVCVRSGTAQLIFMRGRETKPQVTVDLCQVKEIVCDPHARLLRTDETLKEKSELCILLIYGQHFILNSLTFAAKNREEFEIIYLALTCLLESVAQDSAHACKERWLKREFSKIQMLNRGFLFNNKESKASFKQVLAWLTQLKNTVTKQYLMLRMAALHIPDDMDNTDFIALIKDLVSPNPCTERILKQYGQASQDGTRRHLNQKCFNNFLQSEQRENDTEKEVINKILSCLAPPDHDRDMELSLSDREFEDYLLSENNSILKPLEQNVHQSMDFPLCNYWISSSHNTYLAGDQWKGDASVEMYARCLRMGCRCVELDCWDGPEGKPIITHGRSFVTKIRFLDVLHTIKEHAWVTTDYPLILSIENHCSLTQQRLMASQLKEVFQDELLMEPVDPNETQLPSPNQLRGKVIIKNKKLEKENSKLYETWRPGDLGDMSDVRKIANLSMKYASEKTWTEYEVMLSDTHLYFTPCVAAETEEEEDIEASYRDYFAAFYAEDDEDCDEDRPLSSQLWFHGQLDRKDANSLINEHRCHGDGTFLVREGNDGLVLSFILHGDIIHSKIKSSEGPDGKTQYLIGSELWHASVPDLVDYYKVHRLTFRDGTIRVKLGYPVQKKLGFESEEWFEPTLDRNSAEDYLRRMPVDGVFLVRPSSMENCFVLTFRYRRRVSHYQVEFVRNRFVLGTLHFPTMQQLVEYFKRHPLYKSARLTQPADRSLLQEDNTDTEIYAGADIYVPPEETSNLVTVQALYDFHASSSDELSFKRGAFITNVLIEDQPWWKGDHGGHTDKLFPANYVQIVDKATEGKEINAPKEDILHLRECYIEDSVLSREGMHFFQLTHPSLPSTLQIGSEVKKDAGEWSHAILDSTKKIGVEAQQIQKQERTKRIAQELSDLVIYCQAVPYNPARRNGNFCEMSSFSEEQVGKDDKSIVLYNQYQISRVYPKFFRVTSTNFDPISKWKLGCQMVALNYQTPDKAMQINQAMFRQNGGCGYVLKPSFMNNSYYNPYDLVSMKGDVEGVVLRVLVIGGRNLSSASSGMRVVQPYVVVEVLGLPLDCVKERTLALKDKNSLNPVWKEEEFIFHISCPDLAFVRFEVASEDSETSCLSQATFPLRSIRQGFRSVQLKNNFSEPLAESSLLVHVEIRNPKEEEEKNLFRIVEETRKLHFELSSTTAANDPRTQQLQQTEEKLLRYLDRTRNNGSRATWRR